MATLAAAQRTSVVVVEFVLRSGERWWRNGGLEIMQTEVGDLKNPSAVDETVGRLEVTVRHDLAVVQVYHTLQTTMIWG